jgi:RimJ/RimL family protein N-acetyltransferase
MKLRRLRAESRIGFKQSQRLLDAMGFKRMGVMLNGTHYYYARTI